MSPQTSRMILLGMSSVGWILACIFGALALMLIGDARSHDVPWQILGALVVGPMLAAVPVGFTLFAGYRAFTQLPLAKPAKLVECGWLTESDHWRWPALAILGSIELVVLPLSLFAAFADEHSLLISIPLNLALLAAMFVVGCIPYRRRACIAMCGLHLIGIALAAVAAAIEIESVVISGPLLLATGITLAVVGSRPRLAGLVYGFSTVAFIMTSFLVIAIGHVSQRQAEAPLTSAMVAFEVMFAPLGLLIIYSELAGKRVQLAPQFGLRQLMGALSVFCGALALAGLNFAVADEVRVAIAGVLAGLVVVGLMVVSGAALRASGPGNKLVVQRPQYA